MVTKEQVIAGGFSARYHYTGRHDCTRVIGPRGGVRETVTECRPSGGVKTWKTRPAEFRMPVKYGLYESGAITHENAAHWHLASECPLLKEDQ